MAFYKIQIKAHNATADQILKNEVDLILPKFYTEYIYTETKEEFLVQ